MGAVHHPVYGVGQVERWRRGGRVAVVRFESRPLPIEVPRQALEPGATPPPDFGAGLRGSHEAAHAALTLEAMRLGVVPTAEVSAYTVGRDAELAIVGADLARARDEGGAARAFLGDYGTGKTHLLELVHNRALAEGFLVASVVLDARETPPSHPKRVYRALMHGLRYPDRPNEENVGLGHLLDQAAASEVACDQLGLPRPGSGGGPRSPSDRLAAGQHLYLSPAVAYLRSLQDPAAKIRDLTGRGRAVAAARAQWIEQSRRLLLDWLEGHPTISNQVIDQRLRRLGGQHPKIYSLLDFRPWARIYGYLLSGIAALARAVGYPGLVITLDEAEFYTLLSKENRGFARHLFKAWSYSAIGAEVPFQPEELDLGGYGVQRQLPGRASAHPGLYVAFAMTPSPDGVEALEGAVPPAFVHELNALGSVQYLELAARICDFYASARPEWHLPEQLVGPLGKVLGGLIEQGYVANPRQAVKFVIEFLDVVRYHPQRVAGVVRNLQLQLTF